MRSKTVRNQKGVSGLLMVLGSAFMILLPLGFLGWEFLRYTLVEQELRSVANAAALAGAVGIATNGGNGNSLWQQDQQAMSAAYNSFCVNSITDTLFVPVGQANANVNATEGNSTLQYQHFNVHPATIWANVPSKFAEVNFVLLDQNGNQTNWDSHSGPTQVPLTAAASLRVDTYYGYTPPLLGSLGIGPFTMQATSTGGLPSLDVVLCFDMSGSMDDFSNATFVNRYWRSTTATNNPLDPTLIGKPAAWSGGVVQYDILPAPGGMSYSANPPYWTSGPDGSASGPLYYITGCDQDSGNSYNGTCVNMQPPENLTQAASTHYSYNFMSGVRNSNNGIAAPPGNYATGQDYSISGSPSWSSALGWHVGLNQLLFTDLICNLSGDSHWKNGSATVHFGAGTYTFKDIAWGVEASRGFLGSGNLQAAINPQHGTASDNGNMYLVHDVATNQYYPGDFSPVITDTTSWQGAYYSYVQSNTHPFNDAVTAANNFFQFLYGSADCHFGLVCFSDGIGSSPTDLWANGWQGPLPPSSHINGWATNKNNAGSASGSSASIAGPYVGVSGGGSASDPNGWDPNSPDGQYLMPTLPLDPMNDNFTASAFSGTTVNTLMTPTSSFVPLGSTDLTDAMKEGIRELTKANGLTRPNATKALVIFTDGVPNIDQSAMPPSANFSTCAADCASEGTTAGGSNPPITVFSIGLAMDPNMASNQQTLLQGITSAAGGQSTWKQITAANQINAAFQTIAKNLVVITK